MGTDLEAEQFRPSLQSIVTAVRSEALDCQSDSLALLALLRTLEHLHREIRDGFFQQSLPENRQALYALLKDIEASGGWPYISRMKLRSLLENLIAENDHHANTDHHSSPDGFMPPSTHSDSGTDH